MTQVPRYISTVCLVLIRCRRIVCFMNKMFYWKSFVVNNQTMKTVKVFLCKQKAIAIWYVNTVAIVRIFILVASKFTWSLSHSEKWLMLIHKMLYLVNLQKLLLITYCHFYISLLYNQNVSRDPIFKDSEVFFHLKNFSLKSFLSKVKEWKYWMVCYLRVFSWTGILYGFLILWILECSLPCQENWTILSSNLANVRLL